MHLFDFLNLFTVLVLIILLRKCKKLKNNAYPFWDIIFEKWRLLEANIRIHQKETLQHLSCVLFFFFSSNRDVGWIHITTAYKIWDSKFIYSNPRQLSSWNIALGYPVHICALLDWRMNADCKVRTTGRL